ncbi:hypothetical protein EV363DRAFT_1583600 [Boletus edulis]|nr:hypothetical protein EV363DRAFT_1583600 [Boletus edulis]
MLCRHHHHHRASTVDVDDDAVSPIPPPRPHADNNNGTTAPPVPLDAALGLQALGHTVDIYTSHHDPNHCFNETRRDGNRLHRRPLDLHFTLFQQAPSPYTTSSRPSRAIGRQIPHPFLLRSPAPEHDIFFVDQLSTCIPLLRVLTGKCLLFYCHFPDKLLAHARITMAHLSSITSTPKVVYPGINIEAYQAPIDWAAPDVDQINSEQPTLISLNRFEMKKNAALAIEAFALLRDKASTQHDK